MQSRIEQLPRQRAAECVCPRGTSAPNNSIAYLYLWEQRESHGGVSFGKVIARPPLCEKNHRLRHNIVGEDSTRRQRNVSSISPLFVVAHRTLSSARARAVIPHRIPRRCRYYVAQVHYPFKKVRCGGAVIGLGHGAKGEPVQTRRSVLGATSGAGKSAARRRPADSLDSCH
jgi:hypothetical protein